MLYMKNSYKMWESLMRKTNGSYHISEKHIHKWVCELEQFIHNEYRLYGQAYLSQITELALEDKTKKIPYALYEVYRFVAAGLQGNQPAAIDTRGFIDARYVCGPEESERLKETVLALRKAYSKERKVAVQVEEKQKQLGRLEEELAGLEAALERGREKNRIILEEELKTARQSLWEQMVEELEGEKKKAREAIQQAREEEMRNARGQAAYHLRLEEEERYLQTVSADIERRTYFEDELCGRLHDVSGNFNGNMRELTDKLMDNMHQLMEIIQEETSHVVEEMRHNTANAINQVVDTERRLRKDDFEPLLRNFAELQELIYYTDIPEEDIGLPRTKISHYARRFLKVLNRLGYEEYLPEPGEIYDSYYHVTDEEPEDDGEYVVDKVITYGFRRGEEVCLPAKVTMKKRVL